MGIHSSTAAWRILRTEEPGGRLRGVAESQTQLSDQTTTQLNKFFLSLNVFVEV